MKKALRPAGSTRAVSTKRAAAPAKNDRAAAGMRVRFWGVRGSLASPGLHSIKTGGNTSCVEVRCGGETIIFDCGSGLRELGVQLASEGPTKASIFVSHYHYDHIGGLPFFAPAYDAASELTFYGATRKGKTVRQILSGQMVDPYFPVDLGAFNARLRFVTIQDGGQAQMGEATLRAAELNHPGGSLGYRLEFGGRTLVYATDFEHGTAADDRLAELARDADLLIFDSQYLPAEYEAAGPRSKKGWGHSTYAVGAALARRVGVKQLALFHHAPERNDEDVQKIADLARKVHPKSFAATEGMILEL